MRHSLTTLACLLSVSCAAPNLEDDLVLETLAQSHATSSPQAARMRRLVRRLDSETESVREQATKELISIGPAARPYVQDALKRAKRQSRFEVGARCTSILLALSSYEFFPMAVGHKWVYQSSNGDVTFEVMGQRVIDQTQCFEVQRTIEDEKLIFYLSISSCGVKIHQIGEDKFHPPYVEIAFPLTEELQWNWKGTIAGMPYTMVCRNLGIESVKVPLGQFDAYRILESVREASGGGGRTELWLVKGFGIVKLQGKDVDLHNSKGISFTWQLKEFTRAEKY